MSDDWNPYYVAYAAAHGRCAEDMAAFDRERYPGGQMAGFILWMSQRWAEWGRSRGISRGSGGEWRDADGRSVILSGNDHAEFGGWLRGRTFALAEELQEVEHEGEDSR